MKEPIEKALELVNDLVGHALEYARRWPVLPLTWITAEGDCSCDNKKGPYLFVPCLSPGDHLISKGPNRPTQDDAIIRGWWAKWPLANIGICTGGKSNLMVLEVNPRNGGDESLANLQLRYWDLPYTLECANGDGIRHMYFRYDPELLHIRGKIPGYPGLVIKADGDYVLAPPSRDSGTGTYQWQTDWRTTTVASFPEWDRGNL